MGGIIDGIASIGPLDGMWLGAKIGAASTSPIGVVGGTLLGLGLGTANFIGSAFFPKQKKAFYSAIKNGAYAAVDWTENKIEEIGKSVSTNIESIKSVGDSISNFFEGGAKTVSSWFG